MKRRGLALFVVAAVATLAFAHNRRDEDTEHLLNNPLTLRLKVERMDESSRADLVAPLITKISHSSLHPFKPPVYMALFTEDRIGRLLKAHVPHNQLVTDRVGGTFELAYVLQEIIADTDEPVRDLAKAGMRLPFKIGSPVWIWSPQGISSGTCMGIRMYDDGFPSYFCGISLRLEAFVDVRQSQDDPLLISPRPFVPQTWTQAEARGADRSFARSEALDVRRDFYHRYPKVPKEKLSEKEFRATIIQTAKKGSFLLLQVYEGFESGNSGDFLTCIYRRTRADQLWKRYYAYEEQKDDWLVAAIDLDGDGVPELMGSGYLRKFFPTLKTVLEL